MLKEIWRDVENYSGLYQISNYGRIKSLKKLVWNRFAFVKKEEKIFNKENRLYITLSKDGKNELFNIKELVYKTFSNEKHVIQEDKLIYNYYVKGECITPLYNYKKSGLKAIPVICTTTGMSFNSINEANDFYDIKAGAITRCCKEERNSAGKLEDGTKLIWKFV